MGVEDRGANAAQVLLVLHVVDGVALGADPRHFREEPLLRGDGVGRKGSEALALHDAPDLGIAPEGEDGLAHRGAVEGSAHADHGIGPKAALGFDAVDVEDFVVVEDGEMDGLVESKVEPLEEGRGDAAEVEAGLGAIAQLDELDAKMIFARLAVLFHHFPAREGLQKGEDGTFGKVEDARELRGAQRWPALKASSICIDFKTVLTISAPFLYVNSVPICRHFQATF